MRKRHSKTLTGSCGNSAASSRSSAAAAPAKRGKRSEKTKLPTLEKQASELHRLVLNASPSEALMWLMRFKENAEKIIQITRVDSGGDHAPPLQVAMKNRRYIYAEDIEEEIDEIEPGENRYIYSVFESGYYDNRMLKVLLYCGADPNIGKRVTIREKNPRRLRIENHKPLLCVLKRLAKTILFQYPRKPEKRRVEVESEYYSLSAKDVLRRIRRLPLSREAIECFVDSGHISTEEDWRTLCNMVRRSVGRSNPNSFDFCRINEELKAVLMELGKMAPRSGIARIHSLPQFKDLIVYKILQEVEDEREDPGKFPGFTYVSRFPPLVALIASYLTPLDTDLEVTEIVSAVEKLNGQLEQHGIYTNSVANAIRRIIATINTAATDTRIVSSGAYYANAEVKEAVIPWVKRMERTFSYKRTQETIQSMRDCSPEFRKHVYNANRLRIWFAAENTGTIMQFYLIKCYYSHHCPHSIHNRFYRASTNAKTSVLEDTVSLVKKMVSVLNELVSFFRAIVPRNQLELVGKLLLSEHQRFLGDLAEVQDLCESKIRENLQQDHDAHSLASCSAPAP